jgi:hypothetical protein
MSPLCRITGAAPVKDAAFNWLSSGVPAKEATSIYPIHHFIYRLEKKLWLGTQVPFVKNVVVKEQNYS